MTSEVFLPPAHALPALFVYQRTQHKAGARGFPEYAFPKLKIWHECLYRKRHPESEVLVYIRHLW
jgi:hypothetical protein